MILNHYGIICKYIYSFSYDFDRLESMIKNTLHSKRDEIFATIKNPQTKSKSPNDLMEIKKEMEDVIANCKLFDEK